MGLEAPFINYKAGDFFYGFSGARAKLIKQLSGKTTQELSDANVIAWLDQLLTQQAAKAVPQLNKEFAEYLRTHKKWHVVPEEDKDIERKAADPNDPCDSNNLWRKKSKAGLEFLAKNGHDVHFAIDEGFNSQDCISKPMNYTETKVPWGATKPEFKASLPSGVTVKLRIITYAEIRFVYRNRNDDDFKKHIQFWYMNGDVGTPKAAPWVTDKAIWDTYVPQNAQPAI